jgi:hypothetical protein
MLSTRHNGRGTSWCEMAPHVRTLHIAHAGVPAEGSIPPGAFDASGTEALPQHRPLAAHPHHPGCGNITPSKLEEGIKTDPSLASRFMLQL